MDFSEVVGERVTTLPGNT